jgi:hypothetical protein
MKPVDQRGETEDEQQGWAQHGEHDDKELEPAQHRSLLSACRFRTVRST